MVDIRDIKCGRSSFDLNVPEFVECLTQAFTSCNRQTIKIATLVLKLKESGYGIDKKSLEAAIEQLDDQEIEDVVISSLINGDEIINPCVKKAKPAKKIVGKLADNDTSVIKPRRTIGKIADNDISIIKPKRTVGKITDNDTSIIKPTKGRQPRGQIEDSKEEDNPKTPNMPMKKRSYSAAPKKGLMKKPTINDDSCDESSPVQLKQNNKCAEMSVMEFIGHLHRKYDELFKTFNIDSVLLSVIKFVNELINDSGCIPNMALLKYFEIDADIGDDKVNQYHYAPYLVNIAIGLVSQQKTDMSVIQAVFLQNVFRMLAICLQKSDQQKFIASMETQFNTYRNKKTVGLVIPNECFSQLGKEFANSASFIMDQSLY